MNRRRLQDRLESASGGVFLIGLGLLWLLNLDFWPWILVVFAIDAAIKALANEGLRGVFSSTFWLIGFAILFTTGTFWPGILILIGLSIVGKAALASGEDSGVKEKRKRMPKPKRLPVAASSRRRDPVVYDEDEDDEDEEIWDYIMYDDLLHDEPEPEAEPDSNG